MSGVPGLDLPDPDDAGAVEEAARTALAAHTELAVRAETAREATVRANAYGADLLAEAGIAGASTLPVRRRYPRWGWREAARFAVERRMLTPPFLTWYRRYVWHRAAAAARGQRVEPAGMVFTGARAELYARAHHGRLVLGPWCWIGDDTKVRAHEGQVTLGAKVVLGRGGAVNAYLDVEIGDASILGDTLYVCDFDHRVERLDVPIKDQGIVTAPVRIGRDVWVGEKASVLRGSNVGDGSVIGAQGLVRGEVPPFSIAVGVPVRVVRSRLPAGMDPEEAADRLALGLPLPGDPIG